MANQNLFVSFPIETVWPRRRTIKLFLICWPTRVEGWIFIGLPIFTAITTPPYYIQMKNSKKWRTVLRIREPTSTTSWNKTVFQISDDGRTAGTATVPSITQQRRDSRFSHFVYYCPCFYTFIQKLLVNGLRSRYTFESHPVIPAESTHARPFCQPPVSPKREPDPKEKAAAAWPLVNLKEGGE